MRTGKVQGKNVTCYMLQKMEESGRPWSLAPMMGMVPREKVR